MSDRVLVFDTTLRDGEQSPGATMTSSQKLEVARALARLRVDVIEAGFPAASPDDLAAVRAIAEEVGAGEHAPVICGLARATTKDIDAAWEGVRTASRPRIHTFLATSDLHIEHKLRTTRADVLARVRQMVAYARTLCPDVEFSPEDAGRSDPAFLYEVLAVAIEAGARTLNIPDTVGYTIPSEFGALISGIRQNVPRIDEVILSVHCHDDLGLAVANTLAGLLAGARQCEVTINGIGERAGNAALEEVVMALRTRAPMLGLATNVDPTQLTRTSRLVSQVTGMVVQPNKAIVGANAFAHESGIHQDGMLKHQATYEIMQPESVGAATTRLTLGKLSGRAALAAHLAALGHTLDARALERVFDRFKALAERRKHVSDADLEELIADERAGDKTNADAFAIESVLVGCGTIGTATATVRLRGPDGKARVHAAVGTGPVDATFKAIDALVRTKVELLEYAVHSVTEGIDALGHVAVRISEGASPSRNVWVGAGADTDIIVASAKAYLRALNRMLAARGNAFAAEWAAAS